MQADSLEALPPAVHRFATPELVAAASLEINMIWRPQSTKPLLESLWSILGQLHWLHSEGKSDVLLVHSKRTAELNEELTKDFLSGLWREFSQACQLPIRARMATVRLQRNVAPDPEVRFADAVRLTAARNFFPDDPTIFTIHISCTEADAWTRLSATREALLHEHVPHLLWATMGYGFAMDTLKPREAGPAMEDLCMRYLGVDLEDPIGAYAALADRGIRSINWQTWTAARWVEALRALQDKRGPLGFEPGHTEDGVHRWQTGARPSVCDRNDLRFLADIADYAAIGRQLTGLTYELDAPWLPRWSPDTASRWRNRWAEVTM